MEERGEFCKRVEMNEGVAGGGGGKETGKLKCVGVRACARHAIVLGYSFVECS